MHPVVYWGLAGVWLLVLVSAFMSVRSLAIPTPMKVLWFLAIVALPILGLAAYALRCLFSANWSAFKPLFQSRRVDNGISSVNPAAKA